MNSPKNNIYCTLFDSKYLDKGLVLYKSLKKACNDFKLYIFAFDKLCYDVLSNLKLKNAIVISLEEFENDDLKKVKGERSSAEYCWTCTPFTIDYVLKNYNESICTYIDADMYFYQDPETIFKEMDEKNASIIIVEHRFPQKNREKKIKVHGKYCVEFNAFKNNEEGRTCLEWWKMSCLQVCHYSKKQEECVGDQTYLEEFPLKFSGVLETSQIGAGVAPWNIKNYYHYKSNDDIYISEGDKKEKIIFYHFQNIRFLPFNLVNINSGTNSKFVRDEIYRPYIEKILSERKFLYKEYNISFSFKKSVYKNRFLKFIQNYIMPFKINNRNNIISIKEKKQ